MIDGSEKRNGWLNFELQSPHVIERRSKTKHKKIDANLWKMLPREKPLIVCQQV